MDDLPSQPPLLLQELSSVDTETPSSTAQQEAELYQGQLSSLVFLGAWPLGQTASTEYSRNTAIASTAATIVLDFIPNKNGSKWNNR